MSQLVTAIMATDTKERRVLKMKTSQLFQDLFSGREDVGEVYSPDIGIVYKVGVTLGATTFVQDHDHLADPNALQRAIRRTKEQVIEAVFGEFRSYFRQIDIALYKHEHEEAARLLGEMEKKMFEVDQ